MIAAHLGSFMVDLFLAIDTSHLWEMKTYIASTQQTLINRKS